MLTVRSIASGSDGNATLVQTAESAVLIDSGISVARMLRFFQQLCFEPSRLSAIVLTHEHHDHASGAVALARRLGVPLHATAGTLGAITGRICLTEEVVEERPFAVGDVTVTAFALAHDAVQPIGLHLAHGSAAVAIATDLGSIDAAATEWLCQADLVVLEANHDLRKLWHGPYPIALKRRIASATGHLSNEQASDVLLAAAERGRMRFAWLAHLSETNNSQRAALAAARERLGDALVSVAVAQRSRPSLVWRSDAAYLQPRLL